MVTNLQLPPPNSSFLVSSRERPGMGSGGSIFGSLVKGKGEYLSGVILFVPFLVYLGIMREFLSRSLHLLVK